MNYYIVNIRERTLISGHFNWLEHQVCGLSDVLFSEKTTCGILHLASKLKDQCGKSGLWDSMIS